MNAILITLRDLTMTRRARDFKHAPKNPTAAKIDVTSPLAIKMAGPAMRSSPKMKDNLFDSTCR